jgi:hypothetical protein
MLHSVVCTKAIQHGRKMGGSRKPSSNMSDQTYSAEGARIHAQMEERSGNREKELQLLCGNTVYF